MKSAIVLIVIIAFLILTIKQDVFAITIQGNAEPDEDFAVAVAAGDFNGDSFDDLAIGVKSEDIGNIDNAGAVNVIYGSQTSGLAAAGNQIWHQDSPGILGVAEGVDNNDADYFGYSIVAATFDGDETKDLAIGVPGEGIANIHHAGALNVIYGSPEVGLISSNNQLWHQD